MKLFRIWLFGVPLVVASLVALGAISNRVATYAQDSRTQCLLDRQVDRVPAAVADQRNGVSGKARAVQ
jgi:hypothetical protein